MIRRPPRSTLFPYTTLFRSRVDPMHAKKFVAAVQNHVGQIDPFLLYMDFDSGHGYGKRSEEHTSELQSHSDLVCRLLLEKKNNKVYNILSSTCTPKTHHAHN